MAHMSVSGRPLVHIPALEAIANDRHPLVVVQKSAQIGATQLLVHSALWATSTGYAGRGNVLFLMPTQSQMDDFAQSRVDRAIQESDHLSKIVRPEPPARRGADSRRLKFIGNGHLYMRGSDSQRQVSGVDADIVMLDEFDQMADGVFELALKRIASSRAGQIILTSTPRYPETGINGLYLQSDRRRYHIPCPDCGVEQPLEWESNVDLESACIVCRRCRRPMNTSLRGRWIAEKPGNSEMHGYQINRLYSPWVDIPAMIAASESSTPAGQQEFMNSDLGAVYTQPGSGLTTDDLDSCRREYSMSNYAGQRCDMGVDVGVNFHVVIRESTLMKYKQNDNTDTRNSGGSRRLWYAGTIRDVSELEDLIERFNIVTCVIDALPETRITSALARKYPNVWVAYYSRRTGGTEKKQSSYEAPRSLHMNRAEAIDTAFQLFRDRKTELPTNAKFLGGSVRRGSGAYYRQLLSPQRTLEQDANGNWSPRWISSSSEDHFAHAEVYAAQANQVSAGQMYSLSIQWNPSGSSWIDSDDNSVLNPASGAKRSRWLY